MSDLLSEMLDAHGGLDTWRKLKEFTGHMSGGGPLFERIGWPDGVRDVNFTGSCDEQRISQWPIGREGSRSLVLADHATLSDSAGKTVAERHNPEEAFPDDPAKGWDELNLAFFAGYAMWNYLAAPFIFTLPGTETQELPPLDEDGRTLRRLVVRYPQGIATHSPEETFFVSDEGLIVRVDYAPKVTGNRPAANYASEHKRVEGGLVMPTRRIVKPKSPDGAVQDMVVIQVDIDRLAYA